MEHYGNFGKIGRMTGMPPRQGLSIPPWRAHIWPVTEDSMPLPHFLLTVLAVIIAAGVSLVLALAAGIPLPVLALVAAVAAVIAHLAARTGAGLDNGPHHTPGA